MDRSFSFVVPGRPQPKQRARVTRYGHAFTPAATVAYERKVKAACLVPDGWPTDHIMSVHLDVRVARWATDVENVSKSVCDAMNGVAYDDDSLIIDLSMTKVWAYRESVFVVVSDMGPRKELRHEETWLCGAYPPFDLTYFRMMTGLEEASAKRRLAELVKMGQLECVVGKVRMWRRVYP